MRLGISPVHTMALPFGVGESKVWGPQISYSNAYIMGKILSASNANIMGRREYQVAGCFFSILLISLSPKI